MRGARTAIPRSPSTVRPYGPLIDADPVIPANPPSSWHIMDMFDTKTVLIGVLASWLAYEKVPAVRHAVSKLRARVRL